MRSRWATAEDWGALSQLWAVSFGDTEAVADAFFEAFSPQMHTRVIALNDRPAAMASWLPMEIVSAEGQFPAAYIYAVATHPDARGQGLCRTLMTELEHALKEQGFEFTALCPASPSLYDFYASMGYQTGFYCRNAVISSADDGADAVEIQPEDYRLLRNSLLPAPHCRWDAAAMRYLQKTGVRFFRLSDGFAAACEEPSGILRVPELYAQDETRAVSALCHTMGKAVAHVRLRGSESPQGMLKPLSGKQSLPPLDLGFAFD